MVREVVISPRRAPQSVTIEDLAQRYQVLLLDAYGVVVDDVGVLPGAHDMLRTIAEHERELLVVTNDASRLPETVAARFRHLGLDIPTERIITSGSLIAPHFAAHGLAGARSMVLGPEDSVAYVRAAGAEIAPLRSDVDVEALVVCSHHGFPFVDGVEAVLSAVARQIARGEQVALILSNPDLVFPKEGDTYGFTGGAIALLIEAGLARLFPEHAPQFTCLGKPNAPMFQRARELAGTDNLVMVGDQLETDIRGANDAGIDSVLVETGVGRWQPGVEIVPTYVMRVPGA